MQLYAFYSIGSLLSRTSLAEDLEKSPHTIESWLVLLENIYSCYRIAPYGPPKVKAIKKQQKLYLWDWSVIENSGPRFENFVASHLLKWCHFMEDTQGFKMELRYLRDVEGREIDFVVFPLISATLNPAPGFQNFIKFT